MRKSAAASFLLVMFFYALPASACDICSIYRGIEAKEAKEGFNVGVFEQFTHYGTVQIDGTKVPNPTDQHMDSSITQFIVGYQFSDRFGLQVNVPYIHRSFRRPEPTSPTTFRIDSGTESGIGDMSLIGVYRAYEYTGVNTIFAISMLGGIKFPTGDSSRIKEEFNEMEVEPGVPVSGIHGHDLALGSGSFDGVVGTSFYGSYKRMFATLGVQYAIRGEGDFGYRYDNDLTFSFKPGYYLLVEHDKTLGLQFSVSGESKGRDTFQGAKAEDTGITSVFLGPEVSFTWEEKLSAVAGAEFAVLNDNTALQVVPDYKLRAALSWRF